MDMGQLPGSAMDAKIDARRRDAVPLYHQIFLALRDEILNGVRAPGSAVATEEKLAAQFGVSRITARRALGELAAAGLVERRRRTGTRVAQPAAVRPIAANIDQAVESLLAFGRDTAVTVVALDEVAADAEVAAALKVAPGTRVWRAVRVRSQDGAPLGQVVSHTPLRFAAVLTRDALTATPLLELLRGSGAAVRGGTQSISALAADPLLARVLDVEPRAPLLRIERRVDDGAGVPLALTVAHYRADRYRISVELTG
jgi:GntR family transcriptional regulator